MRNGWFIGNFDPNILKTDQFEVGYLKHPKGQKWGVHFHEKLSEYNYLIKGKMTINNREINPGDLFIFRPDVPVDPVFLEDCELICVKVPSVPGDKVII